MRHRSKPIFGIQFHPEVVHSEKGREILSNFLFRICDAGAIGTPPRLSRPRLRRSTAEWATRKRSAH
jgi:GMP synthase (glutamine-hydrolysing)